MRNAEASAQSQSRVPFDPDLEATAATASDAAMAGDAASAGEEAAASDEAAVRREIARLRQFVQGLSVADLRNGDWFAQLLTFSLGQYAKEVDADYFRRKYPHLPPDAVAQARVRMAARYASIEGGLSATAYTGTVAATLGSGGSASSLTLPAGAVTFAVDLTYTSQLQLRLAHDIAVLYGVPLDIDDPDDLWRLIRIAFGIRAGEVGSNAALKAVPAVVRPLVKKVFSGSTLTAVKTLPVVGKHLLQRNLIKFAIPAVGVPLSAVGNYWLTKIAGEQATRIFRHEARIIEAAARLVAEVTDHDALLWVMWLVIQADGATDESEHSLLHHVTREIGELSPELAALTELRGVIDVVEENVWAKVAVSSANLERLYAAGALAAAVDGRISREEGVVLTTLADLCTATYDDGELRRLAKAWS